MANIKETLSKNSKRKAPSITIWGRKALEARYTSQQLAVLKWEAECLEEASRAYSRKKAKKEYIASAYDALLQKHFKEPNVSMKAIVNTYYASLKGHEYRSNHVYNLTIELGYTKDAQCEARKKSQAKKENFPLSPAYQKPVSFWTKISNMLGR